MTDISIVPWAVSEAVITPIEAFSERLAVFYTIGPDADNANFTLFDFSCGTETEDTAVSIDPSPFSPGAAMLDVLFDTGEFGASDLVMSDGSTGEVKFCIRARSYEDEIEFPVAFRDTQFTLGFDLSGLVYEVTSITITQENPDSFLEEDLGTDFTIGVCQCVDYECAVSTVTQNDPLIICLYVESNTSDTTAVNISNFNVEIFAGNEINNATYEPVMLGSTAYVSNVLTEVTVNSNERVMVSTVLIASFFTEGYTSVQVDGLVFLEFVTPSARMDQRAFHEYGLVLGLGAVETVGVGCLQGIIDSIKDFF